jgi:magnesium transporter
MSGSTSGQTRDMEPTPPDEPTSGAYGRQAPTSLSERAGAVQQALRASDLVATRSLVRTLHPAELARLLEQLDAELRSRLIDAMRSDFDSNVLVELDEDIRNDVVAHLGSQDVAAALVRLDSDDAFHLIDGLEPERRAQIFHAIPAALRHLFEQGLSFREGSAGRLMQRELVAIPQYWTVGTCLDSFRSSQDLPDDFYDLVVVDSAHRPIGWVPLDKLVRSRREVRIGDLMETEIAPIPVDMDQEQVAWLFRQYDLISAPVVDQAGRLVGVITVDDVIDVLEEEAAEDLLHLGGISESDIHASPMRTAARRQKWLGVTLINTILASVVISFFETSIQELVALAVLMPIVAAMGGNAGMQVVTIMVRALATRQLTASNAGRMVAKELFVGVLNGLAFASILSVLAGLWFGELGLALVLAAAMTFNMVWAALAGTLIPLALHRAGLDPAIAAGPFLTTTTDVFGFFVFLGLASLTLL